MLWQAFVQFIVTAYDILANGVYVIVGDSAWRQLLGVVVVIAIYMALSYTVAYTADELARRDVDVTVRALYGIIRYVLIYPSIVFIALAMVDGCTDGGYLAAVPVVVSTISSFIYCRYRDWRDRHAQCKQPNEGSS